MGSVFRLPEYQAAKELTKYILYFVRMSSRNVVNYLFSIVVLVLLSINIRWKRCNCGAKEQVGY